jgi:hypothetical protein
MRFLVFIVLLALVCHAYAADEKLTITTYYPSPAGVYKNLRLMPGADPGDCTNANAPIGKLFFNATAGSVYACTQISGSNYGYRPVSQFWDLNPATATVSPVDTSYRVGIGTNNAAAKMHIAHNGGAGGTYGDYGLLSLASKGTAIIGAATSFDGYSKLSVGQFADGVRRFWYLTSHPSQYNYGLGLWYYLNPTSTGRVWNGPYFWVAADGRVGIGTDNPAAKAHIAHNGSNGSGGYHDYGLLSVAANGQATIGADTSFDGYANLNLGQTVGEARRFWHLSSRPSAENYGLGLWYFMDSPSTGPVWGGPHLWVAANGRVGIGTDDPLYTLDVAGNIRARGEIASTLYGGGGQARYIHGDYGIIHYNNGSHYFILITNPGDPYGAGNSLRPFYIHLADGTVGSQSNMNVAGALTGGEIRSSNGIFRSWQRPNFILALQGDRHLVLYDNNRAIWWSGTYLSDIRLKKNVTDLVNVLPAVLSWRAVRFNWKDERMGTKPEIGVIAQDVEKLYPELIYNDKNGNKLVDYPKLSVLLLGAVKEQQKKIDSLEKKVESLTEAVESLRRANRK